MTYYDNYFYDKYKVFYDKEIYEVVPFNMICGNMFVEIGTFGFLPAI